MEDRITIAIYYINQGYAVNKVIKYSGIHKTTWYRKKNKISDDRSSNKGRPIPGYSYSKHGEKVYDNEIVDALFALRQEEYLQISGGYIKLKYYLKRKYGYIVNKKKIYRLCKENNLLLSKNKKSKEKRNISCNRKVTRTNQVWEFDIKYGYIHGWNRFFYILVYIDVFSRFILHYHIGLHCKAKNLAATFSTALSKVGLEEIDGLVIRSDNGPQMTSKQFYKYLLEEINCKITHEFIPCATPNKNAHVESFYSIIENEFIRLHYFKDFKDVYVKFANFIEFYNENRVHSSLKFRTPQEVNQLCKEFNVPNDIKPSHI